MLAKDVCRAESIYTLECMLAREVILFLFFQIQVLNLHLDVVLLPGLVLSLLLDVFASGEEPALDCAAGVDLIIDFLHGVVSAI